jgi:hypothetical protein
VAPRTIEAAYAILPGERGSSRAALEALDGAESSPLVTVWPWFLGQDRMLGGPAGCGAAGVGGGSGMVRPAACRNRGGRLAFDRRAGFGE